MIKRAGFTIIELIVIITVIGLLAAMSFTLFPHFSERGRDAEREDDIHALAALLESYYEAHGVYPTLSNVTPASVKGVTPDLLVAPSSTDASSLTATASPTKSQYGYLTYTAAMTPCTSGADCGRKFTLSWYSEDTHTIIHKSSIN